MTTPRQLFGILLSRLAGDTGLPRDLSWLQDQTEAYGIAQIEQAMEEVRKQAVRQEREACALIADEFANHPDSSSMRYDAGWIECAEYIAEKIRERRED